MWFFKRKPKTIGILGLGSIGSRHRENLMQMGLRVIYYDPGHNFSDSRNDVLNNSDAFVIASPTKEHYRDLLDCIDRKKPILVEKPVVPLRSQLNVFTSFYNESTPVTVGNNLRFHPCVVRTKQILESGDIGDVVWAGFQCSQYNEKPAYLRDGVTLNWGAHEVDLALLFLGPGKLEAACINDQDTTADLIIRHDHATSSVHLDYLVNPQARGYGIHGTKGSVGVDLVKRALIIHKNGHEPELTHYKDSSYDDDYRAEMESFVTVQVNGLPRQSRPAAATLQDGLAALDILLKAKEGWLPK